MNSKVILVLTLHLFGKFNIYNTQTYFYYILLENSNIYVLAQTLAAEFIKKLHSPEWQCKAFCADYGAKSDFDKTSNICRCLQVKNSASKYIKNNSL